MKCMDCKWWDRMNAFDSTTKACCRVDSPSIDRNRMACDTTAIWPITNSEDWCRKFTYTDTKHVKPYTIRLSLETTGMLKVIEGLKK